MRRFIVIFLLLLLPTQILAESLEDLRAAHYCVSLLEFAETTQTSPNLAVTHLAAPPDRSNPLQAVHADFSDSVSSTELYIYSFLMARLWPGYPSIAFPSVYLPVQKPPLI